MQKRTRCGFKRYDAKILYIEIRMSLPYRNMNEIYENVAI